MDALGKVFASSTAAVDVQPRHLHHLIELLGKDSLSNGRRARLCARLLDIAATRPGLAWLSTRSDSSESVADVVWKMRDPDADFKRLGQRLALFSRLRAISFFADATAVDHQELDVALRTLAASLRQSSVADADFTARLCDSNGLLNDLEALAELLQDESLPLDGLVAVLQALLAHPASLAGLSVKLAQEDTLKRWNALLGGEAVDASDPRLLRALKSDARSHATELVSVLSAVVSISAAIVAAARSDPRALSRLRLWATTPALKTVRVCYLSVADAQVLTRLVAHPKVASALVRQVDSRATAVVPLLELVVEGHTSKSQEALDLILQARQPGNPLDTSKLRMASTIVAQRPLFDRVTEMSRLASELETEQTRPSVIWRLRAHLAIVSRCTTETLNEAWSETTGSEYGTLEGEWMRIVDGVLEALEPIIGVSSDGKAVSHAFSRPDAVSSTLLGSLQLLHELLAALRRLSTDSSHNVDAIAVSAARRFAVRKAAQHARAYTDATLARTMRGDNAELDLAAAALQSLTEASLRALPLTEAAEALLAQDRPLALQPAIELLVRLLPADDIGAHEAEAAVRSLAPSAERIAELRLHAVSQTVSLLYDRLKTLDSQAGVGLIKLTEDLRPSASSDEAISIDTYELASLIRREAPNEDDDAALAPIFVKQYQGDEFRFARVRPESMVLSANPRLPSVHVRRACR